MKLLRLLQQSKYNCYGMGWWDVEKIEIYLPGMNERNKDM